MNEWMMGWECGDENTTAIERYSSAPSTLFPLRVFLWIMCLFNNLNIVQIKQDRRSRLADF